MTEVSRKQRTRITLPSCLLRVVDGGKRGESKQFKQRRICLGRDKANDFVLDDPSVSKHHLTLHYEEKRGYRLFDEASTNGVWIGNVKVEQAMIRAEALFQVGDVMLALEPQDEDVSSTITFPLPPHIEDAPPSPQTLDLMGKTACLAKVTVPVLFLGETGTGKGTLATHLHEQSPRHKQPFVHINCAAIPHELFESQMFGYKQGAFTGASQEHEGFLQQADGGTLFLDEIGELSKEHQSKLLTVLDRGEYYPIGAKKTASANFRLLTATNRDLHTEIEENRFREDLYYRIAVYELQLPPLRERPEDITHFASLFLEHFLLENPDKRPLSFTPEFLETMRGLLWPGNIRQLRHAVFAAATHATMDTQQSRHNILVADLPELLRLAPEARGATLYQMPPLDLRASPKGEFPRYEEEKRRHVEAFKRLYIEQLLVQTGQNISKASELSGLNRSYIYTIKKELKI